MIFIRDASVLKDDNWPDLQSLLPDFYQHLQDNIFGKQSKNKCGQILTNFKKMYGRRAGRVALCQKSNSPHIEFRLVLDELREAHI